MNLRAQILRGGLYLALRQGLGIGVGLGGVLLLTRILGPATYGLYASALGVYLYVCTLSQWGLGFYLIRQEKDVTEDQYHQAFTLLLGAGLGASALAILALPLVEAWVKLAGFSPLAFALFLLVPLPLVSQVPLARLERALDYKKVALIELGGQLAFYCVALPLALSGWEAWALVTGWGVREVSMACFFYAATGYRPRLHWEPSLIKTMLRAGLSFSLSDWVWKLRDLVNPLVVGRFGGAEAVGYVALAVRVGGILTFIKDATWRISSSVLARFQGNRERMLRAVSEGMGLQVLAVGFPLVVFGWAAPWLIPLVFGPRWLPVSEIYPFIALGQLTHATFSLHYSTLYTLGKNAQVGVFHLCNVVLFAGTAFLLMPQVGLIAYGWAELAAIGSFWVLHLGLARCVGTPHYDLAGLWWAAFGLALFGHQFQGWAALGLLAIALWPPTWQAVAGFYGNLRRANLG